MMLSTIKAARIPNAGVIVNEHTLDRHHTRRHVDVLSRRFEFIHHDQLIDRMTRRSRRPFCLLTFDDGKRSNYTDAAPELERLGVPAVFYLTTAFVGGKEPLWFDRHDALLATIGAPPPALEAETLKALPRQMAEARLDAACAALGVAADIDNDHVRPMRWEDARDLARRGFTVGAHGVHHSVLTREREDEALRQITQSMAEVSTRTATPCRTFAFPNGNYTARLARHAVACGAHTVMTTEPMWVDAAAASWRLPRIQLFERQSRVAIELKLIAAAARILSNPDGTGMLYRRIARLHQSRNFVSADSAARAAAVAKGVRSV
jgi:peptidoglycan/xylan/chitin deacetylase (PgdA/CDA1 family)